MKKVKLDKDKFKKVLAKTGSTFDNEALAFTRKANAMLKENNMTWEDVELYIINNEIEISEVHTYTPTSEPERSSSGTGTKKGSKDKKTDSKEKTKEKSNRKEEKTEDKSDNKKSEKTEDKSDNKKSEKTKFDNEKSEKEEFYDHFVNPEEKSKKRRIRAIVLSPTSRIIDINIGTLWLCIDCNTINHLGEVCYKCKEYFDFDEMEWEEYE